MRCDFFLLMDVQKSKGERTGSTKIASFAHGFTRQFSQKEKSVPIKVMRDKMMIILVSLTD